MAYLELRDHVTTNPTRLDLAELEFLMLWPNDAAARKRWNDAACKHEASALLGRMPAETMRQVIQIASEATDLRDLQSDGRDPPCSSQLAVPTRTAITQNNPGALLGAYATVAHLWAASLDRASWPCAVADLSPFLAEVRAWQELGEATKTKQGPLLRPGTCVAIPDLRGLPIVEIEHQWKH